MTKPSNLALMLQQMNQEYAVLMLNNKVSILRENGDEKPTFLSKGDFKTLTENKYVSVSKTSRKGEEFMVGTYEWTFYAGDYFASKGTFTAGQPFLDVVPLRFGIDNPDDHYHVPLLVSPWSFSTYRGS